MSKILRTTLAAALLTLALAILGLPPGDLAAQNLAQNQAQGQAQGQGPDNTAYGDLLKKTALERSIVLNKLLNYDPSKYIQQGVQKLDAYWQSDDIHAAFQRHYQNIEKAVQQVNIDPRFSTLDTILRQYKAYFDDTGLKELTTVFVQDALRTIQTTQEAFIEETQTGFGQELNRIYQDTQRDIGNDLDRIVKKQFDYWPMLTSNLGPLSVTPRDIQGPQGGKLPVAGIAGGALVVFQKQITNTILRTIGTKLAGKVAAKFVPYVGWALLIWDFIDALGAKVELETSLRDMFVQEYRASLTPELLWQGSREDVQTQFRKGINQWLEDTKSNIQGLLMEASVLIQNPKFADFVKDHLEKGYSMEDLTKEMRSLHEDFGPLVNELTIDKMYYIKTLLPRQAAADRGFLPRLIDVFGANFLPLVDQHKRIFFEAAWEIGPENLRAILAQHLDPREVYDSYRKLLNHDDSANAKKGFILAWQMGLDLRPGQITASFLEKLFAERDMAQRLKRDEVPQDKLIGILANDKVRGIVANVYDKDLILGGAFARGFQITEMDNRYDNPQKVADLVKLFHAQNPGADRAASDRFVKEIRENSWKSDIFARHGQTGLEIAIPHVLNEPPSAYEMEMAKKAITLYEKGYPLEIVKDRQAVDYAYDVIFLGRWYFDLTYPIQKNLGSLGTLILGLVVLVIVVVTLGYLGSFLYRRFRPAPPLATVTSSPPPYQVRGVGKNEPLPARPQVGGMPPPISPPSLPRGPLPADPSGASPAANPDALLTVDGGESRKKRDKGPTRRGGSQAEQAKSQSEQDGSQTKQGESRSESGDNRKELGENRKEPGENR